MYCEWLNKRIILLSKDTQYNVLLSLLHCRSNPLWLQSHIRVIYQFNEPQNYFAILREIGCTNICMTPHLIEPHFPQHIEFMKKFIRFQVKSDVVPVSGRIVLVHRGHSHTKV